MTGITLVRGSPLIAQGLQARPTFGSSGQAISTLGPIQLSAELLTAGQRQNQAPLAVVHEENLFAKVVLFPAP